jgi:phospholipid/cholesterol/gamma-HCH transport system substrate-binding protein
VSRPRDGFEAGFQLLLDIRSFSLVTGGDPHGELQFEAKILGPNSKILAAKAFDTTAPATGTDAAAAAAALNQAFAEAAKALVPWAVEVVNSAPPEAAPPPEPQTEPQAEPQGEPPAPAPAPPT